VTYVAPVNKSPLTACMEEYLLLLLVEQPDFMFTNPDGMVTQIIRSTGKLPDTPTVRRSYEAALASLTRREIVVKTVKQGRIHRIKLNTNVFDKPRNLGARSEEIRETALTTFLGTPDDHAFTQLVEDCQRGLVALQRAAMEPWRRRNDKGYVALKGGQILKREGFSKERVEEVKHFLRRLRLAQAKSAAGDYVWWWQVEQDATVNVVTLKTRIIDDHIKKLKEAADQLAEDRTTNRVHVLMYGVPKLDDTPEMLPDAYCGPVRVSKRRV
jgi:hypothetical protein